MVDNKMAFISPVTEIESRTKSETEDGFVTVNLRNEKGRFKVNILKEILTLYCIFYI